MNNTLPAIGYLRLCQIIGRKATPSDPDSKSKNLREAIPALIPVSKSTWYQWIRDGKCPKPLRISERTSVWRVEDILEFIEKIKNIQR